MHQYLPPTDVTPQEIQLIRSMISGTATKKQEKLLEKLLPTPPDTKDAFILKSGSDWLYEASKLERENMLFGEFWNEGELCILFADTNVGKSILAVQIGDAIARGEAIEGFTMQRKPQNVLYFDFELSARQFEKRYSSAGGSPYRFTHTFYRVVLNPAARGEDKFKNFSDYINNALENLIITTKARVVIIDNIPCLRSGIDATAAACRLMRTLREMKNRYRLSLLVLAHTTKRNMARPITRNDLQGSKMLLNFADSAFAIGESHTRPNLRYLKQIKQRSGTEKYGAANVCVCQVEKPGDFLRFKLQGHAAETEHLLPYTEVQRRNTEARILTLRKRGLSLREIEAETGLSYSSVNRMLKRMGEMEGEEKETSAGS